MNIRLSSICRSNYSLALITLILSALYLHSSPHLQSNDGAGWDGIPYIQIVDSLKGVSGQNPYYAKRVFPSVLVNIARVSLGIPYSVIAAQRGFEVLDAVMLAVAAFAFGKSADLLKLSTGCKWLAFLTLFSSHQILVQPSFLPIMTDSSAFALSTLFFYAFLSNNFWAMVAVLLVGAFTWPEFIVFMSPLFVFSHLRAPPANGQFERLGLWGGIGLGTLYCVSSYAVIVLLGYRHYDMGPIWMDWLWLSILLGGFFFALATKMLVGGLNLPSKLDRQILVKITVIAALYFTTRKIAFLISNQETLGGNTNTPLTILKAALVISVIQPLCFLLGHIAEFGPILIATLLLGRKLAKRIGTFGLGLTLFSFGFLCLSYVTPSRGITIFISAFILLTFKELSTLQWSRVQIALFVLVTLIYSRIWLSLRSIVGDTNPAEFPVQRFIGGWGNRMGETMYLTFLSSTAVLTVTFYLVLRSKGRQFLPDSKRIA